MSLRQTCTPPSLLGRMNAVFRMLLFGGGSVAGPVGGYIAGVFGLRAALAILAGISACLLVPLVLSPVSRLQVLPAPALERL
jgi:MFS family permease